MELISDEAFKLASEVAYPSRLGKWWEEEGRTSSGDPPENQALLLLLAEVAIRLD